MGREGRRSIGCALAVASAAIVACGCSSRAPTAEQVTEAASAAGTYEYAYDSSGLATSVGTTDASYTITRGAGKMSAGADAYRLDALGRVIAIDDLALAYGPDGQIARATRGGHETTYVYDENGERIAKSVDGAPVAAYADEGYVTATELDEPVRFGGRVVGVLRNGSFAMLAADARGTIDADVNGTSRLASPYGARPVHPDVAAAIDFTARGWDADLGAIRMGVRDYDARVAGFLEPDASFLLAPEKCVASPIECNLYGYARSSPLDFTDPTGRDAWVLSAQIKGVAGIDFRIDKNHDFSLRLDVLGNGSASNSSFNAGWTTRDLLHDDVTVFARAEGGVRLAGYNLIWAQAELRAGAESGLKLDASAQSIPGRVGYTTDFTNWGKGYADVGGRKPVYDEKKLTVDDAWDFKAPKVKVGGGVSINSKEIRTLPSRTMHAIESWWSGWDTQARQLLMGQGGWR